MKKTFLILSLLIALNLNAQDFSKSAWHIQATEINPTNYFGITLANGVVGLVSSPEPMKIKDVVLNGVYDNYQRGRVSNILKTFSHMNLDLLVDGVNMNRSSISNYSQTLDMQEAKLLTNFKYSDKVSVKHELMSLRNLPYTAMSVVKVTALKDIEITGINQIKAPNHLSDIRNYYSEIDRPHILIPLLSSEALSPGKKKEATSTGFL